MHARVIAVPALYMTGSSRLGDHELQTTERLRMTGSAHALRRATMTDFASRDGDVPSHAISARIRAGHAVGPALLAGGLCNGAMHSLAWRECIAANTARSARLLTGHDARWTRGAAPKTQLFGWLQKRTQILLFPCDESDQKCEIVSDPQEGVGAIQDLAGSQLKRGPRRIEYAWTRCSGEMARFYSA